MGRFGVALTALIASTLAHAATAQHHRVAGAPASAAIPQSGVLTNDEIESVLERVLAHQPKDAFDLGPRFEELQGRAFKVVLAVPQCDSANDPIINPAAHSGCWQYHPDERNLHLDAWKLTELAPAIDKATNRPWATMGLSLGGLNRRIGSYVGQNAFGATRSVSVYRSVHFGVGAVGPHERIGDLLPPGADDFAFFTFSKDLTLAPEAARRAVQGLEVTIEGTVNVTPQLGAAYCEDNSHEATYSIPEEREGKLCVLSARIDRVAFVSPSGGTLAEWTRTSAAP